MGAWRIIPADVVTVLRAVGTVAESLCGAADGLPVDAQAALAGTAGSAIIGDALHGFFEFHAPTLTAIGSRISASVGGASAATESYVLGDEEMARAQQAAAVAAGAVVAAAAPP